MALLPTEDRRRAREDRRRAARYKAHLSLQVLAVAGNAVDCSGQTLDIGVGGVRFTIANKLPVGDTILYLVTRPGESSTAGIQCTGKILRCATKCNSHYHEVVATVESSVVVTQDEFRRLVSDAELLSYTANRAAKADISTCFLSLL
jgi:hypothetical protein